MIEKIGTIKNPLTIIAMFAAIAEISGSAVLPFIATANQATYVWFLIVFPILLVLLFFGTLNFNHGALYAPSDYQNEDNFLHSLPKATFVERVGKVEKEVEEEEAVASLDADQENRSLVPSVTTGPNGSTVPSERGPSASSRRNDLQSSYFFAEELVFQALRSEFRGDILRGIRVNTPTGNYIFDGIVDDDGVTTVIEVKFWRSGNLHLAHRLREAFQHLLVASTSLIDKKKDIRLLLVIVTEGEINHERIAFEVERIGRTFTLPVEARIYEFEELKRNAGLIP